MYVFKTSKEILNFLNKTNKSIGLVPTMGALHLGHESLIKKALIENEIVIVTIFINPTQFDNKDDLINYPRNIESDVEKIKKLDSKIIIYNPSIKDIYIDNINVKDFNFGFIGNELEGHFRKNHFNSFLILKITDLICSCLILFFTFRRVLYITGAIFLSFFDNKPFLELNAKPS